MDRKQFTFYESFYKAVSRIKKKADRCDAYDAICSYALFGDAPDLDKLSDAAAIAFELIKPNLDASRKKASSGKTGGSSKQTASKPEANQKQGQPASEKEGEKEKEKEKEKEDECHPPTPLAAVVRAYLDKINPEASQASLDELKAYVAQMGAECCLRAFDIALDGKKANWPYIRGILRAKAAQGVRCLADWDKLEEARERRAHGNADNAGDADAQDARWDLSGVTEL